MPLPLKLAGPLHLPDVTARTLKRIAHRIEALERKAGVPQETHERAAAEAWFYEI